MKFCGNFAEISQDRKEKDIVQLVGGKCLQVIEHFDKICLQRVPLRNELDGLKKEREELAKLKRQIEPEKEQKIDRYEISQNFHKNSKLKLRMMTSRY
jgi:hypothetical protein